MRDEGGHPLAEQGHTTGLLLSPQYLFILHPFLVMVPPIDCSTANCKDIGPSDYL